MFYQPEEDPKVDHTLEKDVQWLIFERELNQYLILRKIIKSNTINNKINHNNLNVYRGEEGTK